jgi:hypothetical protein
MHPLEKSKQHFWVMPAGRKRMADRSTVLLTII